MAFLKKFSVAAEGIVAVLMIFLFLYFVRIFDTLWAPFLVGGYVLVSKVMGGSFLPTGRLGRWMMRPFIGVFCLFLILFCVSFYYMSSDPTYLSEAWYGDKSFLLLYINLFVSGVYLFLSLKGGRLWNETDIVRLFCRTLCVGAVFLWMFECAMYEDLWDGTYMKYPWYRIAPLLNMFSPDERMSFTVAVQSVSLAFLITACVSAVRFNKHQTPFWVAAALFMIFLMSHKTFYLWWRWGTLLPWTGHLLGLTAVILVMFRAATGTFFPQGKTLSVMRGLLLALVVGNALIWMQGRVVLIMPDRIVNLITLMGIGGWFVLSSEPGGSRRLEKKC